MPAAVAAADAAITIASSRIARLSCFFFCLRFGKRLCTETQQQQLFIHSLDGKENGIFGSVNENKDGK